MSANDKEALDMMASDWAKDHDALTARVAKLEAEVEKLREDRADLREMVTLGERKYSEAEAEVEKLREVNRIADKRAMKAEAKLAEARHQLSLEEQQHKDEANRLRAKLAEVEKERDELRRYRLWAASSIERAREDLTLICEFTQEHGDWSLVPAGGAAAHVHNIARAALEGRAE